MASIVSNSRVQTAAEKRKAEDYEVAVAAARLFGTPPMPSIVSNSRVQTAAEKRKFEDYKAAVAAAKRFAWHFGSHIHEKHFTSCLTNVNELVNSELYVKVAVATGESIASLKREYSPQEMRSVLLQDFKNYYEGPVIVKDCVAPKKPNRGVTY